MPRTLNYLGLTDELEGRFDSAEALYDQARVLQERGRAYPATHFVTLWRQAGLLDRRGQRAEARALLTRAIDLVEEGRLRTDGAGQQCAAYFAQFAAAFDQLVDRCIRDGRFEDAFLCSAQPQPQPPRPVAGREGESPRHPARPPAEGAGPREAEQRKIISGLRVRAQLLTDDPGQARKLEAELEKAQQRDSEVWREILNNSSVYRTLTRDGQPGKLLETLRQQVVRRGTVLLAYHIGAENGYLMLLGDHSRQPEMFPLTVPAGLPAALLDSLERARQARNAPAKTSRGLVVRPNAPEFGPAPVLHKAGPLNRELAHLLVRYHRQQIADRAFLTRGLRIVAPMQAAKVPGALAEQVAESLLPQAVRRRIAALAPVQIVVVPDGALHQTPLESLVVTAGPSPRYVLDELPPIVYAPSTSGLCRWPEDRPPQPPASAFLCLPCAIRPTRKKSLASWPRLTREAGAPWASGESCRCCPARKRSRSGLAGFSTPGK